MNSLAKRGPLLTSLSQHSNITIRSKTEVVPFDPIIELVGSFQDLGMVRENLQNPTSEEMAVEQTMLSRTDRLGTGYVLMPDPDISV